jgi:hypothetical protein
MRATGPPASSSQNRTAKTTTFVVQIANPVSKSEET